MERPVAHRPAVIDRGRCLGQATLDLGELMRAGDAGAFPRLVTVPHRFAQRFELDKQTKSCQIADPVHSDRCDPEASLIERDDESLDGEAVQCLAERATADTETGRQRLDPQTIVRRVLACHDCRPEPGVGNLAGRRSRGRRGAIVALLTCPYHVTSPPAFRA